MITPREHEIMTGVIDILKKELSPQKIILFGSRAKGTNQIYSDFDFAVDSSRPDMKKSDHLEQKIEKIAGLYSVDIVYLDEVKQGFKDIVLSTGKVVYECRN